MNAKEDYRRQFEPPNEWLEDEPEPQEQEVIQKPKCSNYILGRTIRALRRGTIKARHVILLGWVDKYINPICTRRAQEVRLSLSGRVIDLVDDKDKPRDMVLFSCTFLNAVLRCANRMTLWNTMNSPCLVEPQIIYNPITNQKQLEAPLLSICQRIKKGWRLATSKDNRKLDGGGIATDDDDLRIRRSLVEAFEYGELSPIELLILAKIDNFFPGKLYPMTEEMKKKCSAGNEWLARWFGLSVSRMEHHISNLHSKGWLKRHILKLGRAKTKRFLIPTKRCRTTESWEDPDEA